MAIDTVSTKYTTNLIHWDTVVCLKSPFGHVAVTDGMDPNNFYILDSGTQMVKKLVLLVVVGLTVKKTAVHFLNVTKVVQQIGVN